MMRDIVLREHEGQAAVRFPRRDAAQPAVGGERIDEHDFRPVRFRKALRDRLGNRRDAKYWLSA